MYPAIVLVSFAVSWAIQDVIAPVLSAKLSSAYRSLSAKDRVDWDNRILSTCASIVLGAIALCGFLRDSGLKPDVVRYESPYMKVACAIVVGYAVADLIIIAVRYRYLATPLMILHHVLTAATCIVCGLMSPLAHFYGNMQLLAELSNPLLHLRRLLTLSGWSYTSPPHVMTSLAFMTTFFLVRVATIPVCWYGWVYLLMPQPEYGRAEYAAAWRIAIALGIVLHTLYLYWFYTICRMAKRSIESLRKELAKTK
ncbi:TLC domain-containing protein 4-like [Branchiostoma floridae]|uniref:TLC domain-containing protein 4-like n=1 Tax=Branchiostoma floridae TaxID=7739 RepID=A0A9J7KR96_BRAFL|nr:TLC domain-containing protein 4-like [Branchiostoma floridae]